MALSKVDNSTIAIVYLHPYADKGKMVPVKDVIDTLELWNVIPHSSPSEDVIDSMVDKGYLLKRSGGVTLAAKGKRLAKKAAKSVGFDVSLHEESQKDRDSDSMSKYGAKFRTTDGGHTIALRGKKVVGGNPKVLKKMGVLARLKKVIDKVKGKLAGKKESFDFDSKGGLADSRIDDGDGLSLFLEGKDAFEIGDKVKIWYPKARRDEELNRDFHGKKGVIVGVSNKKPLVFKVRTDKIVKIPVAGMRLRIDYCRPEELKKA